MSRFLFLLTGIVFFSACCSEEPPDSTGDYVSASSAPLLGYTGYIRVVQTQQLYFGEPQPPHDGAPYKVHTRLDDSVGTPEMASNGGAVTWRQQGAAKFERARQDFNKPIRIVVDIDSSTVNIPENCDELIYLDFLGLDPAPTVEETTQHTINLCGSMFKVTLVVKAQSLGFDCYPPYVRSGDACIVDESAPIDLVVWSFKLTTEGADECDDIVGDQCDVQVFVNIDGTEVKTREHHNTDPEHMYIWDERVKQLTLGEVFNLVSLASKGLKIRVVDNDSAGFYESLTPTSLSRKLPDEEELLRYFFDTSGTLEHSGRGTSGQYQTTMENDYVKITLKFRPKWGTTTDQPQTVEPIYTQN